MSTLLLILAIISSASSVLGVGPVKTSGVEGHQLINNNALAHRIMHTHKHWNVQLQNVGTPAMNMSEYVQFYLYTKENTQSWQQLWIDDVDSIKGSNFNASKPTFFVIHGFLNDVNSEAIQLPKKTLLATFDCNVIGVDWSRIAVTLMYTVAAEETSHVGHFLAEMIKFMNSNSDLDLGSTHLIGHSLGAHVAGFTGKNLKGLGLSRITGLDPAKPGFTGVGPTERLNATDALFVDCIHTCAGDLGLDYSICQADFYPNGGTNPQPGCLSIDFIGTCSHERSVKLYSESVYPTHEFRAKHCNAVPDDSGTNCVNSTALMGQPATDSFRGIYFVETRGSYPFSETLL